MARGGRGGRRGGSRGKGTSGASGFPSGAQAGKTSWAQSGGRATTFQGTAGGNAQWNSAAGGTKGDSSKVTGQGKLFNSTPVNFRTPGGDNTLVKGGLKGAGKLNLPQGATFGGNKGKTNKSIVTPHELAPKGFGGGY